MQSRGADRRVINRRGCAGRRLDRGDQSSRRNSFCFRASSTLALWKHREDTLGSAPTRSAQEQRNGRNRSRRLRWSCLAHDFLERLGLG